VHPVLCIFPQVAENSIIEVGISTRLVHQELGFPVELLGCPIREMEIPIVLVYKELGFPSERWDPHWTCPQGAGIPSRTTWVSHEENGDPHCPCV
jgi:hypothetical protein